MKSTPLATVASLVHLVACGPAFVWIRAACPPSRGSHGPATPPYRATVSFDLNLAAMPPKRLRSKFAIVGQRLVEGRLEGQRKTSTPRFLGVLASRGDLGLLDSRLHPALVDGLQAR
jgi:hypothetical protein